MSLDETALAQYLEAHLPGFRGPAKAKAFTGGFSNPTFLIEAASGRLVLRKKPNGEHAASAHRIEREFTVQKALAGTGIPLPQMLIFCDDAGVLGTPFYVMSYVAGSIVADAALPGRTPGERRALYANFIATLARLHSVDWGAAGLSSFGNPAGYTRRQVERWTRQITDLQITDCPALDELSRWLAAHVPARGEANIVHGDYRPGNLVLCLETPQVAAVLDWELATLGDPLVDLAYFCMPYDLPVGGPSASGGLAGLDLAALGVPNEQEMLAAYAARRGGDVIHDWNFYKGLACFRTAVVMFGVYRRALRRNAMTGALRDYEARARRLAQIGWQNISTKRERQ